VTRQREAENENGNVIYDCAWYLPEMILRLLSLVIWPFLINAKLIFSCRYHLYMSLASSFLLWLSTLYDLQEVGGSQSSLFPSLICVLYVPRSGYGVAYRVSCKAGRRDGNKILQVTPAVTVADDSLLFSMGARKRTAGSGDPRIRGSS
jgi:hypothetical protein